MSIQQRVVALLAAFLSCQTPYAIAGEAPVAPVAVLQCTINRHFGYVDPYRSASIVFVNRGNVPADDVQFTLRYSRQTARFDDRGTFSTGVPIDHAFRAFWNVPFAGSAPASCSVEYVHYADGRSWPAGAAATSSSGGAHRQL